MVKLFDRDKSVISRHFKNILKEELDISVIAKFATTASNGKIYQVDYYNLDMIISVGYRVKSKNGVIFRKKVKLMNIASRIDVDITGNEAKEITYDDCMGVINKLKYNTDSNL